jgi:biotin carboxyl carrier protein
VKYYVVVDGVEHVIELDADVTAAAGTVKISIDERPHELEYHEIDLLGQILLRDGDRSYAVSIEGDEREVAVTIDGHVYKVALEDERERAAHVAERAAGRGGGVVKSVMPGVVVDVLVRVGSTVAEGEPLLILEAMKMQNEISAPSGGVVEQIHVAAGEAVLAGATLVTLGSRPEA